MQVLPEHKAVNDLQYMVPCELTTAG